MLFRIDLVMRILLIFSLDFRLSKGMAALSQATSLDTSNIIPVIANK